MDNYGHVSWIMYGTVGHGRYPRVVLLFVPDSEPPHLARKRYRGSIDYLCLFFFFVTAAHERLSRMNAQSLWLIKIDGPPD
jgi:hypothetical protein